MRFNLNQFERGNIQSRKKQTGVTLLELLIGLTIVGILITSVGPSVSDIIIRNRITSQLNEISGVIQFARHTAIDEQFETTICPTANFSQCSDNWDSAQMVFIDENSDGQRNDDEQILAATSIAPATIDIDGPENPIRFQGNGSVASPATLLFCHDSNKAKYARALIISLQGRVKLSKDNDDNGVHEDNAGNALSCS